MKFRDTATIANQRANPCPLLVRGLPGRAADNGAEFGTAFHWHVLDKGIGHVYIKPRTPRLNGKVQRSHRIDAEEFYRLLDGVIIDDAQGLNDKLQEWEAYYTYHRPHGALGGQTGVCGGGGFRTAT
jgi:transposase InsO family protein